MKDLHFWFEFASTYSYPAAERVAEAARAAGWRVVWRPFLLGPIFASQGWNDSPFNVYPAKGRYMWRDVERVCAKHGIAWRRPSRFPRNGLLAARVACLAAGEPWCGDFVRAVYRANFADDREIAEPEVIEEVLARVGVPGRPTIERALAPDNKERLRRQTEEAAERGIFGAPSFTVGDELFWGNDRLEDALAFDQTSGRPAGRS
ncbi:MAG TPA: 2-hydroxychromene-2-carboxylate isomerase [Candidatus Binatia bacterium]|nr:2-hydroxychromene-2-carboxylate isomerase [Candidatus Binatia bacterium]